MHHRISSPIVCFSYLHRHRDVVLALGCIVSVAIDTKNFASKDRLEDVPILIEVTRNSPLRIICNGCNLMMSGIPNAVRHGQSTAPDYRMPVGAGA